jgi:hypothetical protein
LKRISEALERVPPALERAPFALERRSEALERTPDALASTPLAFSRTSDALERTSLAFPCTPDAFLRMPFAFSFAPLAKSPHKQIFKGQRAGCPFYLFTGKFVQRMKKRMKKLLCLVFVLILSASFARAQSAEVTIQLNEQFFDALLDAIFKHNPPPEFPIAQTDFNRRDAETRREEKASEIDRVFVAASSLSFQKISASPRLGGESLPCPESIRVQREINGVRTAVRLRDGRVFAPIAFTGTYNPPLVGCIEFSGVADATIDLEFDRERQSLIGYVRVSGVNLSGTGGIGSSIIAGMVQSSIDRKINPLQILPMDKISFVVPVAGSKGLRMKAVGMRNEIGNGVLNVRIQYEFQKE